MTHDTEHGATDGASELELGPVELVEVTADYSAALSVPFTSEQLTALERVACEERTSPGRAAQRLVEQALANRQHT